MRTRTPGLVLLLVAVTACGGGSDKVTGPSGNQAANGKGSITAKIDGTQWVATASASATRSNGNIIAIAGTDIQTTLAFAFSGTGPGTYPIGVTSPVNAILTQNGSNAWTAAVTRGSGSITITALDATHVAGTFNFTLLPQAAGVTAGKTLTDGAFDVKF